MLWYSFVKVKVNNPLFFAGSKSQSAHDLCNVCIWRAEFRTTTFLSSEGPFVSCQFLPFWKMHGPKKFQLPNLFTIFCFIISEWTFRFSLRKSKNRQCFIVKHSLRWYFLCILTLLLWWPLWKCYIVLSYVLTVLNATRECLVRYGAILMDAQHPDGSLGYTVLHNNTCQHAGPIYINVMHAAILRLATGNKNMTIQTRNHPLPPTKSQRVQRHVCLSIWSTSPLYGINYIILSKLCSVWPIS